MGAPGATAASGMCWGGVEAVAGDRHDPHGRHVIETRATDERFDERTVQCVETPSSDSGAACQLGVCWEVVDAVGGCAADQEHVDGTKPPRTIGLNRVQCTNVYFLHYTTGDADRRQFARTSR